MSTSGDQPDHLTTWNCYAGDVAFTVTTPSRWLPAQRDYLSGFVTPPPGQLDLGAFSIRVHTDDPAYQRVAATITSSPVTRHVEPVPGLMMIESAQPRGRGCYLVAADGVEHQPGAYAVTAHERHIDLFTHAGTACPHRYPIRLMREAMLRTYEDAGGVIFHAAGVDIDGAGVMVCGRRGAGKTTVTAALLRSVGAALLSNDRLIVHHGGHMVAVPLPVPAGRGTIEAFPELKEAATRALAEIGGLSRISADFGSTVKHAFTARQFAGAFGAGLGSVSTLRVVVVPRLTDTSDPARLRYLPRVQARQVIAENCFTPRDEFWIRPWLIPRQAGDELLRGQADEAIGHITATVPCIEVSFGVINPVTDLVRALERALGSIR
jgi:hypothetical protein